MNPVVEVSHLNKRFRLPLDKSTTLKYRVTHWRSTSRYRDLIALRDVSFDIPEGQFLGIAGPNGCGKSTLLKILCGIYKASSGSASSTANSRHSSSSVSDSIPELTARENIFLGGAVLGLTRAQLRDKIDEVLAFAELEDFAEQKLKNFSSGMQVRLAFTVAILARTDLLIMDEVLAVGDASFQEKCFDVFNTYKREGKTIVLVSHDLAVARGVLRPRVALQPGTGHRGRTGCGGHIRVPPHDRGTRWPPRRRVRRQHRRGIRRQSGSRAIQIISVGLLDGQGQTTRSFDTAGPMTLDIQLLVHQDVGDFVCGMAIRRGDGLLVAGTNTLLDHVTLSSRPTGRIISIRYAIDSLPLLAGGYFLQVSAHDTTGSVMYDFSDPAASFHVDNKGGHVGLLEMHGGWHVERDDDVPAGGAIRQTTG